MRPVNTLATNRPMLMIESDPCRPGSRCVSIQNLDPDLMAILRSCPQPARVLQAMLRVRVIGVGGPGNEDLPDIFGLHQVVETGVRFIPHFPFEPGVLFRAIFDAQQLDRPELSEVLTLEFSLPRDRSPTRTGVMRVFPSCDSLPENLLRFYVCFSSPMQRGRAEEHITLLGPDGRPAPDVLYRPPIELWDRSLRYLTILLDPGRIKRGVGPNRALGPPLKAGQEYTLAIGSGMVDSSGRPLRESFYKSFCVTEAVREPIAVEQWKILAPATKSHQPLEVMFPKPLDWALLGQSIAVVSENGQLMRGRISIDRGERRWSFTPQSRWTSGRYCIRVAPGLEDVCGNSLLGAFDRPLRSAADLACEVGGCERLMLRAHRKASRALARASGCSSGTKWPESGMTIDLTFWK
jgi:hypothetical protein